MDLLNHGYNILYFSGELFLVGLAFFLIERLKPAEKTTFFKDDFRHELGFALLNVIIAIPLYAMVLHFLILNFIHPIIPYQAFSKTITEWPIILQIIFGLFLLDFSTYWRHRFTHIYMWPYHSIHHAARGLNWLTSMRLHPIDILVAVIFDLTFLHILGFQGPALMASIIILKCFNYFTHANINLKFGKPLRYIFASPHYHRWHHAGEREAYNKNYCSTFSCLDLLFGTYYHPEHLPKGYGLEPREQKNYPKLSFIGQLFYPFKKTLSRFNKNK